MPVLLSLWIGQNAEAQLYRTWLLLNNQPATGSGYLFDLKDSSMTFSPSGFNPQFTEYSVEHIEAVEVRGEGEVLMGVVVGVLIGGVAGAVLGAASVPECEDGDKWCEYESGAKSLVTIPLFTIGFATAGGVVGGFTGSMKYSIPINGSYEKYHDQKEKLRQYVVQQ